MVDTELHRPEPPSGKGWSAPPGTTSAAGSPLSLARMTHTSQYRSLGPLRPRTGQLGGAVSALKFPWTWPRLWGGGLATVLPSPRHGTAHCLRVRLLEKPTCEQAKHCWGRGRCLGNPAEQRPWEAQPALEAYIPGGASSCLDYLPSPPLQKESGAFRSCDPGWVCGGVCVVV